MDYTAYSTCAYHEGPGLTAAEAMQEGVGVNVGAEEGHQFGWAEPHVDEVGFIGH